MNGSAQILGGHVQWDIAPTGTMRTTVIDLVVRTQMAGAPATDVTINGYSAGSISTTGGAWNAIVSDYNLIGEATVLGSTMSIPFSSASGAFGGGSGLYGCTDRSLSLEHAGLASSPRHWVR